MEAVSMMAMKTTREREGNGIPLQYPHLENPMDRGAWWATVYRGHKWLDTTERLMLSLFVFC